MGIEDGQETSPSFTPETDFIGGGLTVKQQQKHG